jgi:hypothetical protein
MKRVVMESTGIGTENHAEVAELLSHVRSMISTAGAADKINAEEWLMAWLDTPNGALGGVKPRRLLKQIYTEPNIS